MRVRRRCWLRDEGEIIHFVEWREIDETPLPLVNNVAEHDEGLSQGERRARE